MIDRRRILPSIDALLKDPTVQSWIDQFGRETVKSSLRRAVAMVREGRAWEGAEDSTNLLVAAAADLATRFTPALTSVINGTGVVLHTNLGRAPLAQEAIEGQRAASGYGNVELSLETGIRGSRYDHCTDLVCELTGAEAALVTNNNAAAVSLVVNEFARGQEALISRGELVEIGGSFRIPDVITRSGATLREVGTTNRTRTEDFASALGEASGLILRVHPSNYRIEGFVERPPLDQLVRLASEAGVPLVHDVGSGLLSEDFLPGFPKEPTVLASLAAGVGLVTWSGDKLLGGPQAGIIAGASELVERLKANPLLRAFRVDKTTLAALEVTLMLHRDPALARRRVPTLRMLTESAESVEARARGARPAVADPNVEVTVERTRAIVGGGAFPGFELASAGWVVRGVDPERLASAARAGRPPMLGRIDDGAFVIDLRAVVPGEETVAAQRLSDALEQL